MEVDCELVELSAHVGELFEPSDSQRDHAPPSVGLTLKPHAPILLGIIVSLRGTTGRMLCRRSPFRTFGMR